MRIWWRHLGWINTCRVYSFSRALRLLLRGDTAHSTIQWKWADEEKQPRWRCFLCTFFTPTRLALASPWFPMLRYEDWELTLEVVNHLSAFVLDIVIRLPMKRHKRQNFSRKQIVKDVNFENGGWFVWDDQELTHQLVCENVKFILWINNRRSVLHVLLRTYGFDIRYSWRHIRRIEINVMVPDEKRIDVQVQIFCRYIYMFWRSNYNNGQQWRWASPLNQSIRSWNAPIRFHSFLRLSPQE